VLNFFHYTDKGGWNAIRAQSVWHFQASQRKDPARPYGAYFTDIEPTQANLRTLYKRLRLPKVKQEYVFWFLEKIGFEHLNGGRGRDKRIFFSRTEYHVIEERQKYGDTTEGVMEKFQ
jgi:hypothetical protein